MRGVGEERQIIKEIKKGIKNLLGHKMSIVCLLKTAIKVIVEGK